MMEEQENPEQDWPEDAPPESSQTVRLSEAGGQIKQLDVELQLIEANEAQATTQKINGFLECVIINSTKPVDLVISTWEGLILLDKKQFSGEEILPLRIDSISPNAERFNFAPQKWPLNDEIVVFVQGQKEAVVNVKIRYV